MKKTPIKKLTITIENLSKGKEKGFCATFKELGNSVIMADSIKEIFDLIPELINSAKKNEIGIFKKKNLNIKIIPKYPKITERFAIQA